jgi:hypothetical protein
MSAIFTINFDTVGLDESFNFAVKDVMGKEVASTKMMVNDGILWDNLDN